VLIYIISEIIQSDMRYLKDTLPNLCSMFTTFNYVHVNKYNCEVKKNAKYFSIKTLYIKYNRYLTTYFIYGRNKIHSRQRSLSWPGPGHRLLVVSSIK